jgi:ATP-dependent exoDNAse (exonuclease V) beta subunit
MVALLTEGRATLTSLVALTFTEKAAAEMKLRLRTEVERARVAAPKGSNEHARLERALAEFEVAEIGTIHGFATNVLRRYPMEAGLDPLFGVADEAEQIRLYRSAFEVWFQAELSAPHTGVARVLRRKAPGKFGGGDSLGARGVLFDAGLRLVGLRDFPGAWSRPHYDREPELDAIMTRYEALAALATTAVEPEHYFSESIRYIASFADDVLRLEEVGGRRDYDAIEEVLRRAISGPRKKVWQYKGWNQRFGGGKTTRDVAALRDALYQEIRRVLRLADAELAALLQQDLQPLVARYVGLLRRAGKVDFLDLLVAARDLLGRSDVSAHLGAKYTHVLIDEFQDTDPTQVDLLQRLLGDAVGGGRLFLVGDPKQSIYRFRRADVALYQDVKASLAARGVEVLTLSANFRATAALCDAANEAFREEMAASHVQATYVPMRALRADGPLPLVALPVPAPYSPQTGKVSSYYVGQSLPDAVAAFVEWLTTKSGMTTVGVDGAEVPVEARHVCLLFRRFASFGEDVARPYARALEARRIPHVLLGGRGFYAREEVSCLLTALTAVEWPDDELSVYATLRGPFFALSDEALFLYREAGRSLHPLHPSLAAAREAESANAPEHAPVERALRLLARLHRRRHRRGIAETMIDVLEQTRAHAAVAFWPSGEQALANLLRFVEQARVYERHGTTSFRAFLEHIHEERDRGGVSDAPVVEESSDGVRLMTVHKAKGLEFPVVILVDPSCPEASEHASRYIDPSRGICAVPLAGAAPLELTQHEADVLEADRAEAIRLAYVAATRARDMLVIPIVGDGPLQDGWLRSLNRVVYPQPGVVASPLPLLGTLGVGADTVAARPTKAKADPAYAVRSGLYRREGAAHAVAVWDLGALTLGAEEGVGLRQQRVLAADAGETQVRRGQDEHARWLTNRVEVRAAAGRASLRSMTMTAAAAHLASVPEDALDAELRRLAKDVTPWLEGLTKVGLVGEGTARATSSNLAHGGARLGTLVHEVLAALARIEDAARAESNQQTRWIDFFARTLGATREERDVALTLVRAALAGDVLRAAFASPVRHHELPLVLRCDGGLLLEGTLDLAYAEPEGLVVVDFKTDRGMSVGPSRPRSGGTVGTRAYELQTALYAMALERVLKRPTRACLLYLRG